MYFIRDVYLVYVKDSGSDKNTQPNLKMGKGSEQTFLQRSLSGQYACEKMLSGWQGSTNLNHNKVHYTQMEGLKLTWLMIQNVGENME